MLLRKKYFIFTLLLFFFLSIDLEEKGMNDVYKGTNDIEHLLIPPSPGDLSISTDSGYRRKQCTKQRIISAAGSALYYV